MFSTDCWRAAAKESLVKWPKGHDHLFEDQGETLPCLHDMAGEDGEGHARG